MRHAFLTEVAGWREAFRTPGVVRTILARLLLAVSLTLWGAVMVRYTDVAVVVLAGMGVVLLATLALLRWRGYP